MNNIELYQLIDKIGTKEYNRKIIYNNCESIIKELTYKLIIKPNTIKLYNDYIKYREELRKQS